MGTSLVQKFQKIKWQRKCVALFCTCFLIWEKRDLERKQKAVSWKLIQNVFLHCTKHCCVNHFHVVLRTRAHEESGKDKAFLWTMRTAPRKPPASVQKASIGWDLEENSLGKAFQLCSLRIPVPSAEAPVSDGLLGKKSDPQEQF